VLYLHLRARTGKAGLLDLGILLESIHVSHRQEQAQEVLERSGERVQQGLVRSVMTADELNGSSPLLENS
jgi:hypothetical protein